MKTGIFFFLTLLLISDPALACTCSEKADSPGATDLMNRSYIMVMGRAVEKVDFSDYDKRAVNVIFVVDSVIKGPTDLDRIIINQFSTGNCMKIFNPGERYLITGLEIKEFVLKQSHQEKSRENPLPPPPNKVVQNKMICYDYQAEEIEFWNELAHKNFIVSTDQCRIFRADREMTKYF